MSHHLYVASWSEGGRQRGQVFGGLRGLFYAAEGTRQLGGTLVDRDADQVLIDTSAGYDVAPRCPEPRCAKRCTDPSTHLERAIAAWQDTTEGSA